MKYSLRLVWYVVKICAIALAAFAVLAVTFFVAMDSANVYVVVTDGMKARAAAVLTPSVDGDLSKYFAQSYLKNETPDTTAYSQYVITDFNYKMTVESLWCKPWENTATVTVVENIPDFRFTASNSATDATDTDAEKVTPPTWPKTRYQIQCRKVDGAWRMTDIKQMETLLPDPTRTPQPSTYVTATPLPTPSPTPVLIPTANPDEASAEPAAS